MATVRIFLDPGHGGADPGAVRGDLTEAVITLDLALMLMRLTMLALEWETKRLA